MNWLGGLQVWSESARRAGPLEPDSEGEWLWVKPKKGCAIVNLGDAMVRFTNGALCSGRYVDGRMRPNLTLSRSLGSDFVLRLSAAGRAVGRLEPDCEPIAMLEILC